MENQSNTAARYSYLGSTLRNIQQANRFSNMTQQSLIDEPSLRCGTHLPHKFRQQHYVVAKWQDQALPRPGWDRQWALINCQYVLVEISTGLILAIVTCIQ